MAVENSITEVAETSLEFKQKVVTMRKSVIQYEAREIPEYWLIAPEQSVVMVLTLKDGSQERANLELGTGSKLKIMNIIEFCPKSVCLLADLQYFYCFPYYYYI